MVGELIEVFSAFDRIGEQFGCERIKTTGDTYLCIAGMNEQTGNHTAAVANAALRFARYIRKRNENGDNAWQIRRRTRNPGSGRSNAFDRKGPDR